MADVVQIRRCQPSEAREVMAWIKDRHYLQSTPPGYVAVLEFIEGKSRVGAMMLGRPASRELDADKVLELTRMYFVDQMPTNTESRALAMMRKWVRTWLPGIKLLLAYSDPQQGHTGTVLGSLRNCDSPTRTWVSRTGKWKKRFPSRKARFCTQFLKMIPTREDVLSLLRKGHEVLLHSGVRRAEANGDPSNPRYSLPERSFDDGFGCHVFRPLLHWTTEEVVAYSKRFGLRLNPLYSYGARRVGCFPCINSSKSEIAAIARHFPERIDEIREQERGFSTFFARKTCPERFRSLVVETRKGPMKVPTIDDVVRWSQTGPCARERSGELFPILNGDAGLVCPSGAGMCE